MKIYFIVNPFNKFIINIKIMILTFGKAKSEDRLDSESIETIKSIRYFKICKEEDKKKLNYFMFNPLYYLFCNLIIFIIKYNHIKYYLNILTLINDNLCNNNNY
jgi:hypothetical protein